MRFIIYLQCDLSLVPFECNMSNTGFNSTFALWYSMQIAYIQTTKTTQCNNKNCHRTTYFGWHKAIRRTGTHTHTFEQNTHWISIFFLGYWPSLPTRKTTNKRKKTQYHRTQHTIILISYYIAILTERLAPTVSIGFIMILSTHIIIIYLYQHIEHYWARTRSNAEFTIVILAIWRNCRVGVNLFASISAIC